MRMKQAVGYILVPLFALILLVSFNVSGQQTAQSRISAAIDNSKLTVLRGNVHPLARSAYDRGAAPASLPMDHMTLVLQRSAQQEAALETLLAQQQTPSSPNYHKWLTPEQFGQQFGASDQDIQKITAWLQSQGFTVNQVANGKNTIDFSGNAGQVQAAFHTAMHSYVMPDGVQHWANSADPQIPVALAPVVVGISSLNNFPRQRMSHNFGTFRRSKDGKTTRVSPNVTYQGQCNTDGNCYAVGPGDFDKIYNVPTSVTGAGQTIAIVSDSDIYAADVNAFRTLFNLPAIKFQQIETSTDPGVVPCASNGNECEAVLDVEWASAIATGAQIDLVVSPTTNTTFGGDSSANYIIQNNLAGILSYSYGACELALTSAGNAMYQQMWSQAAAQGITVSVSTGDNGSAGCESPDPTNIYSPQPATTGLAVNGVGSTPYNVAVGGTDFSDVLTAENYWNTIPGMTTVKSYIPEVAYNDSCTNPIFASAAFAGISGLSSNPETNCNDPALVDFNDQGFGGYNLIASFGGGGGPSNCTTPTGSTSATCAGGYAKPAWQTGPGVPADGKRDTPDVSLFSGDSTLQNFYIVCEADENGDGVTTPGTCSINANNGFLEFGGVGGTSVAAQAFAGIVALMDQQAGGRQGNLNPEFYGLAAQQNTASCNASSNPAGTCTFIDTTSGTIAMPCSKNSPNCVVSNSGDTIGILSGYNAGVGYDLATGLGSINVGNLVNKFSPFYLSSTNPTVTIPSAGGSGTMTVTAYPSYQYTGSVTLSCSGLPTGDTCTFNPATLTFTSSTTATTGIPITVTVTSAASGLAPSAPSVRPWTMVVGLSATGVIVLLAFFAAVRQGERRWSAALALVAIAVLITTAACSGGPSGTNSNSGGGSTGGSNTSAVVTATAANGSPSYSMPFTVTTK